ncbi:hypothetical protein V9L05_01330 [Bernardetia sp. Wsw4-3y2]|uniref:hypothetical protein n=1 Tax=Bernardetia sp. Wsw4-3y2 TaxID=3127471 RepID=UPI0030CFD50F
MSVIAFEKEKFCQVLEHVLVNKKVKSFLLNHIEEIKEDIYFYKNDNENEVIESIICYCFWYAYIGNQMAYNINYQENNPIDYEDKEVAKKEFENEVQELKFIASKISSFNYNLYTNNGNCFYPPSYLKYWNIIYNFFKQFDTEL